MLNNMQYLLLKLSVHKPTRPTAAAEGTCTDMREIPHLTASFPGQPG